MAGTITYDTVGSTITAGESGNQWARRYVIDGMTSGPDIPSLIDEAYALIPDTGTAAPAPIFNMFVREASISRIWCATPGGTTWNATGTITYSTPTSAGGTLGTPDDNGGGLSLSSTSTVEEIETSRDRTDTEITTTNDNVTMTHLARTFQVGRSFSFRRLESSSPRARQTAHEGTLNSGLWNGYGAETVLCQTIDWQTDDFGVSYIVDYTFVYRPGGWQFTAIHEDPYFPGRPLPGATGGAVSTVDLIDASNFALLNITLPS